MKTATRLVREVALAFRMGFGEIPRSPGHRGALLLVAAISLLNIATLVTAGTRRAIGGLMDDRGGMLFLLVLVAAAGAIGGELRSRRAEVLLVSGADESAVFAGLALARVVFFLVAAWSLEAVGLAIVRFFEPVPDPGRVAAILLLLPFSYLAALALGILFSVRIPGALNILALLGLYLAIFAGVLLEEKMALSVRPFTEVRILLAGGRFCSAAGPEGVPFLYADWWQTLLRACGKSALLLAAGAVLVRFPRWRVRGR